MAENNDGSPPHSAASHSPGKTTDGSASTPENQPSEVFNAHGHELSQLTDGARAAAEAEKQMTSRQALQQCLKSVMWAIILATAVIMEGFDIALLGGFYAFPPFNERYGTFDIEKNKWELPPAWITALSAGAMIGQIVGLNMAGMLASRFGYRKCIMLALVLMIAFIFIPVFAPNLPVLVLGEILQGIPWGVFETMPAAYASEIAPLPLRHYLTTYSNLCWVLGQFIAAGVLRGFLGMTGDMAYRIPFMIQWVWPLPILIACFFAPESPWWLVRNGQSGAAKVAFSKLTNYTEDRIDHTIELITHTVLLEKKNEVGTEEPESLIRRLKDSFGLYRNCFRGIDRRRAEIACLAWTSQALCGSNLMGFTALFFQKAGLSTDHSFTLTLAALAVGACGVVIAWILMEKIGRRILFVGGLFALIVVLTVMGVLGFFNDGSTVSWIIAILLVLYIAVYDSTVGPSCYCIVTEIPSTALRASTVALARMCYNVSNIFNVSINPQMLTDQGWGWGPKTALFWAGVTALCFTWAFFRLPETRGRNYGELDVLFRKGISARKFATTQVDQFNDETVDVQDEKTRLEKIKSLVPSIRKPSYVHSNRSPSVVAPTAGDNSKSSSSA